MIVRLQLDISFLPREGSGETKEETILFIDVEEKEFTDRGINLATSILSYGNIGIGPPEPQRIEMGLGGKPILAMPRLDEPAKIYRYKETQGSKADYDKIVRELTLCGWKVLG